MIVIDVETTGLDPNRHSIISLGAVDFNNKENLFYEECRLKEDSEINLNALKVNGFTEEQINNQKLSCKELLEKFIEWSKKINDMTIGGHNVQFDISFLQNHFKHYNLKWIYGHKYLDLHSIFYFQLLKNKKSINLKDNKSDLNLDFIIKHLGLKKRTGLHNALEDAQLTAEAFSYLLNYTS